MANVCTKRLPVASSNSNPQSYLRGCFKEEDDNDDGDDDDDDDDNIFFIFLFYEKPMKIT